jgi:uncharacterized protein (TIGR03118 family)
MNKFTDSKIWVRPVACCFIIISCLALGMGCRKSSMHNNKELRDFRQVNLVANSAAYSPLTVDPTLQNAWGLAWAPSGIAWVNSLAGHVSELYTGEGAIVRPPVNIPSPADTVGGNPTGIVFSGGAGFTLSNNAAPNFLFVGVDGVLSGWNGAAGNNALRIRNGAAPTSYTGLALSTLSGKHFLYGANFGAGKIDVWDTAFTAVAMPFHDHSLPSGYSPFNIQAVGSWLYVTYAKPGPDGRALHRPGVGIVDIFNTNGTFVKRFASGGSLNAPWGVVATPANFLEDQDMMMQDEDNGGNHDNRGPGKNNKGHDDQDNQSVVLVGNFGDGRINAYSMSGDFLGQLQTHNRTIVIDGLWALSFAPATATTIDPKRLYFTAGPKDETDGLFGYLIRE